MSGTQAAVIYDPSQPLCDECGVADEETVWCGNCGCCRAHCQGFEGCGDE